MSKLSDMNSKLDRALERLEATRSRIIELENDLFNGRVIRSRHEGLFGGWIDTNANDTISLPDLDDKINLLLDHIDCEVATIREHKKLVKKTTKGTK